MQSCPFYDVKGDLICTARVNFFLVKGKVCIPLLLCLASRLIKKEVAHIKSISNLLFILPDTAQHILQEGFYISSVASVFAIAEPKDV